jgi:hypothetical protein
MSERTKRYVVLLGAYSRASSTIETGTYGRSNPFARDALREAAKEQMVDTRTGVKEEGAA